MMSIAGDIRYGSLHCSWVGGGWQKEEVAQQEWPQIDVTLASLLLDISNLFSVADCWGRYLGRLDTHCFLSGQGLPP